GMARETTLLTLRDPAKWREMRERENLPPGERRRSYAETLSRLITKSFNGTKVGRVTTGSSRSPSGVGRHARLVLKSDGQTALAIGAGGAQSQAGGDALIAARLASAGRVTARPARARRAKGSCVCL